MGSQDLALFKHLDKKYTELNQSNEPLTQKEFARLLGVNYKTVSNWLTEGRTNHIDFTLLATLRRNLKSDPSSVLRQMEEFVLGYLLYKFANEVGYNLDELSSALSKYKKIPAQDFSLTLNSYPVANSALFLTFTNSDLLTFAKTLLASKWSTSIKYVCPQSSADDVIHHFEEWAYSDQGNFSDVLEINVYTHESEPIAEVLGIFDHGEFVAYLRQEQLKPMSQFGHELLLQEYAHLSNKQAYWQLPKNPVSRLAARLIHDQNMALTPEEINFLSEKIAIFEANQEPINQNAWEHFKTSILGEIESHFGFALTNRIDKRLGLYALMLSYDHFWCMRKKESGVTCW